MKMEYDRDSFNTDVDWLMGFDIEEDDAKDFIINILLGGKMTASERKALLRKLKGWRKDKLR